MKTAHIYPTFIIMALCTTLISGCASSPRSQFYTLTATAPREATPVAKDALSISIASVTIPELVDRPQLVVRTDGSLVDLLETHRWAEPLKSAIPRIIAENISRILAVDRVSSYPQNASYSADFKVYVDLLRFDSVGDHIVLDALWMIRRSDDRPAQSGRSQLQEKVSGSGYEAVVAAFSRGLGKLSLEIAQALKTDSSIRK